MAERYAAYLPLILVSGVLLCVLPWARVEDQRVRSLVVYGGYVLLVRYLYWRLVNLPSFDLSVGVIFSYLLCIVESVSTVIFIRSMRILVKTLDRSPEADLHQDWFKSLDPWPLIDVFVPTYNENEQILEKTLVGCKLLDYPRLRIWILDDGGRAWLEKMATDFGVRYLKRADRSHYKAGNLNNAYRHVLALAEPPEFIAIFDADFVPKPRFLRRVLALMWDPKVAMVGTPQLFYNPDPFQVALGGSRVWPDDMRSQFDVRLPSQDAAGRAFCCGTSFLVRTRSLHDIGGFPTETVSEDTLMSMKLGHAGWRNVYLNEPLSMGLAAEGLQEYMKQRARWCLGTIQNMKTRWGPRSRGGPMSYLLYLESVLKWGLPLAVRALFLLIPVIYWFTGFTVIRGGPDDMARYVLPMLLLRLGMAWLYKGRQLPIVTDAASLLTSFVIIPTNVKALMDTTNAVFQVTNKGINQAHVVVHWCFLRWLLLYAGLLIAGMVFNLVWTRDETNIAWHYYWSYYALLTVFAATVPCVELPRRRAEERFATQESARVSAAGRTLTATLCNLSILGAHLRTRVAGGAGDSLKLELRHVGWIDVEVVRRIDAHQIAVSFKTTLAQRHALIRKLYCTDEYLDETPVFRGGTCLKALLTRALT